MAKKSKVVDYTDVPETLENHPFYGLILDNEQQAFRDAIWSQDKRLFFVNSIAGSGKTLIAVATGLLMVKYGLFDRIVYVTFAGNNEKELGYLKGTYYDKALPYYQPLFDAIETLGEDYLRICNFDGEVDKFGEKIIQPTTSTYMRGINLHNAFVICDESENATLETLAKVISRISDDCICCVLGHTGQIDFLDKRKSGFAACIDFHKKYNSDMCEVFELKTNHRGWISEYADLMLQEYKEPSYGFIYMTKNLITGKLYIGQHRRTMNLKDINDTWYMGSGVLLKKAFIKYGMENFHREIIYECDSQSELDYMEQVFIQFYNAVDDDMFYNLASGGNGNKHTPSEEQKEHMRKPHKPMDEETKKRWIESHKNKLTEDGRKKLSQSAISNLTGYIHSEESKRHMSEAHKGSKTMFKDGIYKNIVPKLQEEYLADGWVFRSSPKPSQNVKCVDIISGETAYYKNVDEASAQLGIPSSTIRNGAKKQRITRKRYKFSYSNMADELE